jgi:hypothetical protein
MARSLGAHLGTDVYRLDRLGAGTAARLPVLLSGLERPA